MSANPMEEQIGRLVGNLLAGGGEVFLPGVGSLYVERQGAKRLDKRSVLPPCRVVLFTSQQRGVSLVDEIARIMRENGMEADDPESGAQAVYDRWIARVHKVNLLTVEGVGELRFKNFMLEAQFDRRLNPQGHEPVRIPVKRRFDWAIWVGVAAILIAVVYGGREFLMLYPETPKAEIAAEIAAEPVPDSLTVSRPDALAEAPGVELPGAAVDSQAGNAVSGTATAETAASERVAAPPSAEEQKAQETPMPLLSGRHYVVLGVFSTVENAARAIRETAAKEPGFRCRIYYFGEKFMVSPFSSDDTAVCAQFIRAQSEHFPGMWTYTAR